MGYDMSLHRPGSLDDEQSYYRLNIFGMGNMRCAMRMLGMMFDSTFPVRPDEWPDYDEDSDDEYVRRVLPLLARHGGEAPGIPSHKLCSNNGWWVTDTECDDALGQLAQRTEAEIARALGESVPTHEGIEAAVMERVTAVLGVPVNNDEDPPIPREAWDSWVEYLRLASTHGGFRVY